MTAWQIPTAGSSSWGAPLPPEADPGQAALNAPVDRAQREQVLAEAQAGTATAGAQGQAANDQALARLVQVGQSNPAAAQSPLFQKMLGEKLKALGITQPPMAQGGGVDFAALNKMLSPPTKPWSQWTAAEVQQEMALDPKLRSLPPDAPPEALTHPATPQISTVAESKMYDDINRDLQAVGKGVMTPDTFIQNVLSQRARYQAAGLDTSGLDVYLNDARNGPSNYMKEQVAGPIVQANIDKLKALGVHLADEDEMKKDMLAEKKREFDKTLVFKRDQLSVQDRKNQAMMSMAGARLQVANANLAARWQSIDMAKQSLGLRASGALFRMADSQMTQAKGELSKDINVINNMSQNPQMRKRPEFQALVDQATALKGFIDQHQYDMTVNENASMNAVGQAASAITGVPTTPIQQPAPPATLNINVTGGSGAPGGSAPALGAPGAANLPGSGKALSRADAIRLGASKGMNADQAVKAAQALGYQLQ